MLAAIRGLIRDADPEVVEAVKWVKPSNPDGVLEWSDAGGICTGEVYKDKVKLTFHHGAKLDDPAGMFNASLEGATRRAIDFFEGDEVDDDALTGLIQAAVAFNQAKKRR